MAKDLPGMDGEREEEEDEGCDAEGEAGGVTEDTVSDCSICRYWRGEGREGREGSIPVDDDAGIVGPHGVWEIGINPSPRRWTLAAHRRGCCCWLLWIDFRVFL